MAADPLLTKRKKRAAIGVLLTTHLCIECRSKATLAKGVVEEELLAGDDAGKPYTCDRCGKELKA